MKKQLLALFISISSLGFAQVCIPDTNITVPGIFPPGSTQWDSVTVMPDAYVGIMYDEVAQILAPSDTVIDTLNLTIPATIDSIIITGLDGLPASMSFACDNSSCFYLGGEHGCMKITGSPTSAEVGVHLIKVWAYGGVTVQNLGTLADSIFFLMRIEVKASQSLDENQLAQSIHVTPNPIVDLGVVSFTADDAKPYQFELIDITGKRVLSKSGISTNGINKISVRKNGLSEGLYFYSLNWNGMHHSGRLMFTD